MILILIATLLLPDVAHAHGDREPGERLWAAWDFDFWIVGPLILAGWVYIRGGSGGAAENDGGVFWQHAAFFGGLTAFYLVLQSPIEPISDHVFFVHQIEHMALRTVGPMLLMLSAPQARLIRGLPNWARRSVLAPVTGNRVVRRIFGPLTHPVGATLFFLATSYFWMFPSWHDRAIRDEPIHYTWHISLMVSGLIFFWRVLDPRPRPLGLSMPVRFAMLWFGAMGNILLGSYLSLKTGVLYHVYDVTGRWTDILPATDEHLGGLTMWIPGAMMFALAGLALVHRWRRHEERAEARRLRAGNDEVVRAEQFVAERRGGNRMLGYGIAGFVAFVFVLSILVAVAYDHGMLHS